MSSIVNRIARYWQVFGAAEDIGYAGATSTATDARRVFSAWRAGEDVVVGPYPGIFEKELSRYYQGGTVITFGAGRMALYAILRAMQLRAGDEIIVPGYTCIVTPQAVCRAGLRPVYVDVSPEDFNIRPDLIAKAITPRTRAVLAQHTFGIPCDMAGIEAVSRRHGIPIIEDGAHAIGSRWQGKLTGRLTSAAFFSTQLTKTFSTERGGFVVTADEELARRVRALQEQAPYRPAANERACLIRWCYNAMLRNRPTLSPRLAFFETVIRVLNVPLLDATINFDRAEYELTLQAQCAEPYPCRLPNLMAMAGLLQLRRLESDLSHRRMLAGLLLRHLPALGGKVPCVRPGDAPNWLRFPVVVTDRDRWEAAMRQAGLAPGTWFTHPIHPAGSDYAKVGYVPGVCPVAEYLAAHMINIPVDTRVTPGRLTGFVQRLHHAQGRRP